MQLSRLNWWDDFIKLTEDTKYIDWEDQPGEPDPIIYIELLYIYTLPSHQYNLECCKKFWTKITVIIAINKCSFKESVAYR